jgi:hypothetical protein
MPDKDGWKKIAAAMERRQQGEHPEPEPDLTEAELTRRRLLALRAKYVVIGDKV